jgi:hypothetical protein
MARLVATVHVSDASGVGHVFGPGSAVPEWAVALITNPKAWDELPRPEEAKSDKPFSQLNKSELEAVAVDEGIDISEASTNDEIRAAIKAARESK